MVSVIHGLEHYLGNAALLDEQCRPLALREMVDAPVSAAADGHMQSGWSWGAELDDADAIFVLNNMHTLTGIRVYSGIGAAQGRLITRFRLWYTTAVPENISDIKLFTGGWGMSDGRWMSIPFLRAETPEDGLVAVQDNIVLTARPDSLLVFPPLLVKALRITVEDTQSESVPAVLNEFQAIAPRHLNPAIDAPDAVMWPARGYIWPMYNATDAWCAAHQDCPCHVLSDQGADGGEYDEASIEASDTTSTPYFSWEGALAHNESLVLGTLVARVRVHNFAIPEQGQLELYVQNIRVASTAEDTVLKISIAELSHGLHVFTARLRDGYVCACARTHACVCMRTCVCVCVCVCVCECVCVRVRVWACACVCERERERERERAREGECVCVVGWVWV